MTTKTKWRLKELPSPLEVADLVKSGILTKDEAREILISQETDEDRDKKSLQDEIKFLRELVSKLSVSRTEIVRQIEYIEKPYVSKPWYLQYQAYCTNALNDIQSGNNLTYSGTTNTVYNLNSTAGSTSASLSFQADNGFNEIETF